MKSSASRLRQWEKRKHPRVPADVRVRVEAAGTGRTYHSDNLSGGGVFLLSDDPLPEETRVDLRLHLPRLDTPVPARGEVVWRQRQDPCGFAVKFTEISNLGRHLIKLHLWPAAAMKT